MVFGCAASILTSQGRTVALEEGAAPVVLLQRQDDGAHRQGDEGAEVGLALGLELRPPGGRVVVELLPGAAEEPPERREDDEQDRDGEDGLDALEERAEPAGVGGHRRRIQRQGTARLGWRPRDCYITPPSSHERDPGPRPSSPTSSSTSSRRTSQAGKNGGKVTTRFPPEPNGYLHIGHAKSICLNFGIAQAIPGAVCNLRFDDTNPSIGGGRVRPLDPGGRALAGLRVGRPPLLRVGLLREALRHRREAGEGGQGLRRQPDAGGDARRPGELLPGRPREPVPRPQRRRRTSTCCDACGTGEFPDGAHVLRAKIDMQSPNQNLRDPVMYRIKREHHHRTGDAWCIYPMYDFAHGYSDAIEGVTHSICTLEFENHRPLYDWFLEQTPEFVPRPHQTEFARLNLTYMTLSKRKLKQLVDTGRVDGLGRSADADARGPAPARVHAGGHPRVLRPHRRLQAQQLRRRDAARARRARGPQRPLPPGHGRRAPAPRRARELPRGAGGRLRRAVDAGRPVAGLALHPVLARCSTSTGRTSPRCRPRAGSACRRGPRCGCATRASSSASAW